jgi:hypothetical protein
LRQAATALVSVGTSVGKAQEWNDSAAQTRINATRMKSTNSRSFIVEAEVPK